MNRRTATVLAIMALVVGLAGCARTLSGGPGVAPPPPTEDTARMRQQAQDALARWEAAVKAAGGATAYVPVRGQSHISDWSAEVGEKYKGSITSGKVELSGVDPALTMPPGKITWADGTSLDVKTVTAGEAVAAYKADNAGGCAACNDPVVPLTSATPTTLQIETTRGTATVPAWKFRIADTDAWVGQGAVAVSVRLPEPPWDSNNPPVGTSIDSAVVEPGGQRLTASLIGSREGSQEPCGIDYTAEAVESEHAVVVIIHTVTYEQTHPEPTDGVMRGCPMVGFQRKVTVELAAPLGNRSVLENRTGMPVPLS
jgi:hypothetical protein